MTTPVAAACYLAEHQMQFAGRNYAVYNPNNLSMEELPVIYGFNNGGSVGWLEAVLLAEDGTYLGGHCCSDEGYMWHDLGILEGTREDRHETFKEHYPSGYRMDFVRYKYVDGHEALNRAFKLNEEKAKEKEKDN